MSRLMTAMTDRHVEIMRDELAEICYDVTRGEVEYIGCLPSWTTARCSTSTPSPRSR
jgi:hypothetical protein